MNKRKKELSDGNSEFSISKAQRNLQKNSHLTAENNLEVPRQLQSSHSKRKKTTAIRAKQKWEEKSQENTDVLAVNLQTSSNGEERNTGSELKQLNQAKEFISLRLSQNSAGKFVPVFAKPKKVLTETFQRNDGEAAELQPEQHKLQEILESNLHCTEGSLACESPAKSLTESFQLIQTKVQETGDMIIPHCQKHISEELDVSRQNWYTIKNITNETASVSDSQQETGMASNIQEDNCNKNSSVEVVPLFTDTLCHKDAGPQENRNLSVEPLECPVEKDVSCSILAEHRISDNGESNQNEDDSLVNVDQKKPTQEDEIAIKLGNFVKEKKWTKHVRGEVINLVDTSIKNKIESNIIKPQVLVDLNVSIAKEENNSCPDLQSRAEEQSRNDKGTEQSSPFKDSKVVEQMSFHNSGKIAEHNATQQSIPCISAGIVVEQRGNCKVTKQSSMQSSGGVLEQTSLHSSKKVAEQSSPHSSGRVSEKISSDKDSDISGKDFLSSTQFRIVDMRTDVEVTESKSAQAAETVNVFSRQSERYGHSDLLQPAFFSESDTGKEEAGEEKKTSVGSRVESDPDASTLLIDSSSMCENNQDHITLEQCKENGSEKVRLDIEQKPLSICGLRSTVLEEKLSNIEIIPQAATQIPETKIKSLLSLGHPLTGKSNEEMVVCEQNKTNSVPKENCLPPIDVLEQLEREKVIINHKRETEVNSGAWKSPAADIDLPNGVPRDPPSANQTCSSWGDELSLDVELLPDSQLQGVFGNNRLEFPLQQPFSTDSDCSHSIPQRDLNAGREQRGPKAPVPVIDISYLNKPEPRVEMMEGGHDPTKEEDATDVVCGLIIELSNLNRLIMSTHRDLESLKRLKYRKSRRSGKFCAHALKGATNTLYTVKKME